MVLVLRSGVYLEQNEIKSGRSGQLSIINEYNSASDILSFLTIDIQNGSVCLQSSVQPTVDTVSANLDYVRTVNRSIGITDNSQSFLVNLSTHGSKDWVTGAPLNTARNKNSGAGTHASALCLGGSNSDSTHLATVEQYNAIFWYNKENMNVTRVNPASCGVSAAALVCGGNNSGDNPQNTTEKYNGYVWAYSGNLPVGKSRVGACGSINGALLIGEGTTTYKFINNTWSATTTYPVETYDLRSSGTSTAAVAAGGIVSSVVTANTYLFNGTTWTASGSLNIARKLHALIGSQTTSVCFGGLSNDNILSSTEVFTGAGWAIHSYGMIIPRGELSSAGTNSTALAIGGGTATSGGATVYPSGVTEQLQLSQPERIQIAAFGLSGTDTWMTTASVNYGRENLAGCGTQNAALAIAGYRDPDISRGEVEKFNGTVWAYAASVSVIRSAPGSAGIQNNALVFGGYDDASAGNLDDTEIFNGLTWSSTEAINLPKQMVGSSGKTSAALCFGGSTGSGRTAVTELFNGSTWSTAGGYDMNAAKDFLSGCGVQNATIALGGVVTSVTDVTEKFNGSTWSVSSTLNSARYGIGPSGVQNNVLAFTGYNGSGPTSVAEKFDGTTWVVTGSTSKAKNNTAGSGTQNSALSIAGGDNSAGVYYTDICEKYFGNMQVVHNSYIIDDVSTHYETTDSEYEVSSTSLIQVEHVAYGNTNSYELTDMNTLGKNFSDNYWTTSGTLNTARGNAGCTGLQNAAVCFGGLIGSSTNTNTSEVFNGSTWSASENLSTAKRGTSAAGIKNAAASFGGYISAGTDIIEKFNGFTWSDAVAVYASAVPDSGAAGRWNNAIVFGGGISSPVTSSQKFNGLTTTTVSSVTGRLALGASGCFSSAVSISGYASGAVSTTESFNGTTWSSATAVNVARYLMGATGVSNNTIIFGGQTGASTYTNIVEIFNGTSWSIHNIINTTKFAVGGTGSRNSTLCTGGQTDSSTFLNVTEKLTSSIIPNVWNYGIVVTGKDLIAI